MNSIKNIHELLFYEWYLEGNSRFDSLTLGLIVQNKTLDCIVYGDWKECFGFSPLKSS